MQKRLARQVAQTLANAAARQNRNIDNFEEFVSAVHDTYMALVKRQDVSSADKYTLENLLDDIDMQELFVNR